MPPPSFAEVLPAGRFARVVLGFAALGLGALSSPGQTITLDNFNSGATTGAVVTSSSWSGQVTQNATSITVGGTATNVNGWSASRLALDASTATYLRLTVQLNSGNAANTVKTQFEDSSVNTAVFSVPTAALTTGVLTQVQIPVGTWGSGFDPASIASWSLGGGNIGSAALRMTFEHLELGSSLLALDGGTILTAGNQNYTTAQTLGGTTILNNTGSNGTAVTFGSTLNGAHGLTINTAGTVTFSRAVGNGTSLASLTVAGGASTVVDGGSIRTTGAQTYSGTVTLGDDTTFRSISGALTFLGAITGNNRALIINTTGAASSLVSASALSSFTKIGTGTLTLTGQSTYAGTTFINAGTLALGTNQALPAAGKLSLAGGTLALQGHAQTLGLLAITANSTINFSTGGTLVFANSSAEAWTGTLTITNYNTATNTFQFSTTSAGLTLAQLANIRFADYGNAPGQISALGIVTPSAIPEPSTYAALLAAAALALAAHRRRKNRSHSS